MVVKTARDLKQFFNSLSDDDLELPVYFDTEGRTFDYHCAKIGSASKENEPKEHIILCEAQENT